MPQSGVWRFASASVRGASHEAGGGPCQDAHCLTIVDGANGPVLVLAVSDGAGSAAVSEVGADIAVNAVCEQAEAWLSSGGALDAIDRGLIADWLCGVREMIAEAAADADREMRDFACTILLALVGEQRAAFAQLGDGAMVVLTGEREWSWVFWPQHGPYANTTFFVTDDIALEKFEFDSSAQRVDEIALFSDGLERLVLDHKAQAAHEPFFNRMFGPLRASAADGTDPALSQHLADYLGSQTIRARSDDDITLVLACRASDDDSASAASAERIDVNDDATAG
jgi:hypothetical protein